MRKEEDPKVKDKRIKKLLDFQRAKKMVTIVCDESGALVIGAVFHILNEDNTGEFDPYFIDRMKNALQMMRNKHFAEAIE